MGLGLGMGLHNSGSRNGTIPNKSDALFWLDGTILDVTGTKYFVDKISGKNFLITGYDFDTTWTKGFPYKSAATISAPAGDATLIAADINSYLYTAGTPNQIPVISLFQDVDYEHKLFCRHSDQRVDGNGVETYEPRVLDVVLYDNVKATADLTKCQSYFRVPVEATTNVMWMDPVNGLDTNTGTKALPFKTFGYPNFYATNGFTVYIKSGLSTVDASTVINRSITYKGIGFNKFIGTGGSSYIAQITGNPKFEGITFDGTGLISSAFGINTGSSAFIINKCKFINAAVGRRDINITGTASGFTLSNSIISHNNALDCILILNSGHVFSGNYFTGNMRSSIKGIKDGQILYNKFHNCNDTSGNIITASGASPLNIKFNTFNQIGVGKYCIYMDSITTQSAAINIERNRFYQTIDFSAVVCYPGSTNANAVLTIANNNFYQAKAASVNTLITVYGHSKVKINNNLIDCNNEGILIYSNGSVMDGVEVKNNYIKNLRTEGHLLTIGGDSDTNGFKITGAIVENNTIIGKRISSDDEVSQHGILLGYLVNITCRYNYINGSGLGLIVKGDNNVAEGGLVYSNVIINCNAGLYLKGCKNYNFSNNTILSDKATKYFKGIFIVKNLTYITKSNVLKNNIVIVNANNSLAYNFYINDSDSLSNTIDNNLYYNYNISKLFNNQTVEKTFAEWNALGYDANSHVINATQLNSLFSDIGNNILTIPSNSYAVGIGEDLGATYDDGLDASTSRGSDTQLPVVVTKQQGASWDIGAYIH